MFTREHSVGRSPVRARSGVLSAAAHAVLLLGIVGVWHSGMHRAPYRLPGTTKGVTLLTYYSPGSLAPASSAPTVKPVPARNPIPTPQPTITAPPAKTKPAPSAEPGTGTSDQSGIGEGDINIALQKFFPYPKPDLSALPHKTSGDVVLNATIDEHGNISELTLVKGLGPAIDNTVIATVKQWTYTPATRNGVAVPSEQELHFHYERG